MNKNDLFLAFDSVDDDILERSEILATGKKAPAFRKWGVLAACMALVVTMVGGIFVAEAKEYSAAVEFFETNCLSTEGLSRSDVKAVYRDITTNQFTYSKTAEVIEQAVPGIEISQRQPTPEELANMWTWKITDHIIIPIDVSGYRIELDYKKDEKLGIMVRDKYYLKRYENGEQVWQTEFDKDLDYWSSVSEGAVVWGRDRLPSSENYYAWIALVDENGNILWEHPLDHGFKSEYIFTVLDNRDGTWAIFSKGDSKYFCLSQYDREGNELSFRKTEMDDPWVINSVRLGDGYLVQFDDSIDMWNKLGFGNASSSSVFRLDRDGNLSDSFTYEGEDCDYYITDMIEFEGRMCLSAYAVPKSDPNRRDVPTEIVNIVDYVKKYLKKDYKKDDWGITSEALTPLVRDNYTAVLLLCDSEGGTPEIFYSVTGSIGGKLAVNDAGELVWNVESVVDTYYSPFGFCRLGGTCQMFRYTFDKGGIMLRREDIGETVHFVR